MKDALHAFDRWNLLSTYRVALDNSAESVEVITIQMPGDSHDVFNTKRFSSHVKNEI